MYRETSRRRIWPFNLSMEITAFPAFICIINRRDLLGFINGQGGRK